MALKNVMDKTVSQKKRFFYTKNIRVRLIKTEINYIQTNRPQQGRIYIAPKHYKNSILDPSGVVCCLERSTIQFRPQRGHMYIATKHNKNSITDPSGSYVA
jgi:hypothetical protein